MSEKTETQRDGARMHKNSGRGDIEKGDATIGPFTVDYKEYARSFGVSITVWGKATKDALRMRAKPALKLVLGDGPPQNKTRVWVIGDDMFHEMLEAWKEKYEPEI